MINNIFVCKNKTDLGGANIVQSQLMKRVPNSIALLLTDSDILQGCWTSKAEDLKNNLNTEYVNYLYFIVDGRYIDSKIIKKLKTIFNAKKLILYSGGNALYTNSIRRCGSFNYINELFDVVIANSNFSKQRYIDWGIDEKLIVTIRGGVDTNFHRIFTRSDFDKKYGTKNSTIICCVSRFVPWKGLIELVHNIKLSNSRKLLLIGDSSNNKPQFSIQDEDFYNKIKTDPNIIYLGSVSNLEAINYLEIADISVDIPVDEYREVNGRKFYWTETFGRSLCESISVGTPIIARPVGAIPEFFKENDYIGEQVNSSEFINEAIDKILADHKTVKINCDYSWEYYVNSLEKIIKWN